MDDRLHDDEVAVDEGLVRSLLADGQPGAASARLAPVGPNGTSNVLWRVRRAEGADLVVRLPRIRSAARSLVTELSVLDQLVGRDLPVELPVVRHIRQPNERYPYPWAVLDWIDGVDAWTDRARPRADGDNDALALSLADFVTTIADLVDIEAPRRRPGQRGGSLAPMLDGLDRWLDDPVWAAPDLIDVVAVRRLADAARELPAADVEPVFVHADLLPANLVLRAGRLAAVIDWGSAGIADPAQDLAPAWALFDDRSRRVFREAMDVDDATWLRAKAFELQHAVGAVLYYRPRRHPLADIMARTLERLLADADR